MPTYVYKNQEYVLNTTDSEEAKNKIKAYLGETDDSSFADKAAAFSYPFLERVLSTKVGIENMFGLDSTEATKALAQSQEQSEAAKQQHPFISGAGTVLSTAPNLAASVVNPLGAVAGLSSLGVSESEQIQSRNRMLDPTVDSELNELAGFVGGMASSAGGMIPIVGKTLGGKVASGVAGNVGLGVAERASQNEILDDYSKLQQGVLDPTAMTVDALFGGLGGVVSHIADTPTSKTTTEDIPVENVSVVDDVPNARESIINDNLQLNAAQIENAEKRIVAYKDSLQTKQFKTNEEAEAFRLETEQKIKTQEEIIRNSESNIWQLLELKKNKSSEILTPSEEKIVDPRASGDVVDTETGTTIRSARQEQVADVPPEVQINPDVEIANTVLRELGLQNDNITIKPNTNWYGRAALDVRADRMEILLNPDKINETHKTLADNPEYQNFFANIPEEDQINFTKAWAISHEAGHALMYKLLQVGDYTKDLVKLNQEFINFKAKNNGSAGEFGTITPIITASDHYDSFHEFFAQRVARNLTKSNYPEIYKFVSTIKDLYNKLKQRLGFQDPGFDIDKFIQEIIRQNKELINTTGRTLWETLELQKQNKNPNYKPIDFATARGIARNLGFRDNINIDSFDTIKTTVTPELKDQKEIVKEALIAPDLAPTSGWVLLNKARSIGKGFTDHFFGLMAKRGIYSDNPVISHVANVILNAKRTQISSAMELLNGVADRSAWDNTVKTGWVKLARLQSEKSVSYLLKNMDNESLYEIDQVIRKGYGIPYAKNLELNGKHLTQEQIEAYNVITSMFSNMQRMATRLEKRLGKSNIMSHVEGWYPAQRHGDFSVSIHADGIKTLMGIDKEDGTLLTSTAVYSQRFFSREEAENFRSNFDSNLTGFSVGEIIESSPIGNVEGITGITHAHMNNLNNMGVSKEIQEQAQEVLDRYLLRGGVLGSHHKFRSNIPGYMGSELFSSKEDVGNSFRKAIFNSVEEYTRLFSKLEIKHYTDAVLDDFELTRNKPNTVESAKFMRDFALNDLHGFGKKSEELLTLKPLKRFIDSVYIDTHKYNPMRFLGAKKYPDMHVSDRVMGELGRFFYSTVLMARPTFWVSQGSQFLWSARSAANAGVGPIESSAAFGRAIQNLTTHKDKDFMNALFYVSQNTNTFHPQFIHALNDFHMGAFQEGKPGKMFMDWILGEKPSTMADTFSRLMSFAWMYEVHKEKGLKGTELWKKAAADTDENMVQYGRSFRAPIFQELGVVGEMMAPLQTFSQAALGNMIADINRIAKAPGGIQKLRASMPLAATTMITLLMTGGMGVAGLAEYEGIRLVFNKIMKSLGLETQMPSAVDYFLSGDTTIDRAISHGLPAAASMEVTGGEGIDMFSSNRWQPIMGGILQGEKDFIEMLPIVNWAIDMISNAAVIMDPNTTRTEARTAAMAITPGAWKELTAIGFDSLNREQIPNKYGAATVPETTMTNVARGLGSKTITQAVDQQRNIRFKNNNKLLEEEQTKLKKKLYEAVIKKDTASINEIAEKLYKDHGQTQQQLETYLNTEMYRRNVPEGMRQFVGQSGNMSRTQQRNYMRYQEMFGNEGDE